MIEITSEPFVPTRREQILNNRATSAVIDQQSTLFKGDAILDQMLDAVPDHYVALNEHLQVVFANDSFTKDTGRERESFYGERLGEIINCVNSDVGPGGCGTSEACRTCIVTESALAALHGTNVVREARLTLKGGTAVDVRVFARKLIGTPEPTVLLAISNIEHEQRRRVLERTFFHDVLNTAGSVHGLVEVLPMVEEDETDELMSLLEGAAAQLIDEIKSQRLLTAAESGELKAKRTQVRAVEIAAATVDLYRKHDVAAQKNLVCDHNAERSEAVFESDPTILRRILGNLVKNALEAVEPGMTVTIGVDERPGEVGFWIHNDGVMPPSVQSQMFQRSFSTKGTGRGIGTYSVRMFTEEFLGGEVSFTSTEDEGTIFRVWFPLVLETSHGASKGSV
jgi:signal transduction histidine kinase